MRAEKPTLAFVDHSYHKKTRSSDFFLDLLKQRFSVKRFWDDSWKGGKGVTARDLGIGFDLVVFWQIIPPILELRKMKAKLAWLPMYDSVFSAESSFWENLQKIPLKIVSFSENLSLLLSRYKLDHITVKFFPDTAKFTPIKNYEGVRIFFWQRGNITFEDLKPLLKNQRVDQFFLRPGLDPNYTRMVPGVEDRRQFNIRILDKWFRKREEYLELLGESNVFIAPREYEGIGMGFLEPMCMGLVVVAVNKPVANEYIKDGFNGFLFEKGRKKKLDFSNLAQVGRQARRFCEDGCRYWRKDHERIFDYISSERRSEENDLSFLSKVREAFGVLKLKR